MNNITSHDDFNSVSSGFGELDSSESELKPHSNSTGAIGRPEITDANFTQGFPVWSCYSGPEGDTFFGFNLYLQGNIKHGYSIGKAGEIELTENADEGHFTVGQESIIADEGV